MAGNEGKSLDTSLRYGSLGIEREDVGKFPFDAFSFETPDTDEPELTLNSPWKFRSGGYSVIYKEISSDVDYTNSGYNVNGTQLVIHNTDTSAHTVTLASGVVDIVGAGKTVKELYSGSWQNLSQLVLPPGIVVEWNLNTDPATYGVRYLLLNGQGILRANYPELDTNVYVGDGNNATASAYYHADNAAGTTRNTTGVYLILPESRGYFRRGLDTAASVDPDGASRDLGSTQLDAFQGFTVAVQSGSAGAPGAPQWLLGDNAGGLVAPSSLSLISDGTNGTPRTSSESRSVNVATTYAIKY